MLKKHLQIDIYDENSNGKCDRTGSAKMVWRDKNQSDMLKYMDHLPARVGE